MKKEVKIKIIDSVNCQMDKWAVPIFKDCMSYTAEVWRKGPYRKERKEYQKSMLGKDGLFLTGFLERIIHEANKLNIELDWEGELESLEAYYPPILKKITFREDQLQLIQTAIEQQRGVLQAPTGIGKTVLALGIMSCFPTAKILFLVHEKTLMNQTYDEMVTQGFNPKIISRLGGGYHDNLDKITIGMTQTFNSLDPSAYVSYFDLVIVDECHLFMGPGGTYEKVLSNLLAPAKFGLTATLPNQMSHRLVLEGLIGPVIGKLTIQEGVDLGLLAKPKIKIVKVPFSHKIRELRGYQDVYEQGIVLNQTRNTLLVNTTLALIKTGLTCLVLVTRTEHGQLLAKMFTAAGLNVPFVWGQTEADERNEMRKALQQKDLKCIVASSVFRHGINIPSLGAVINAAGEKSEVSTLQRIGRGLRTTDEKKDVVIVDFFDESHPYLVAHFGHRISLYCEEGWLG